MADKLDELSYVDRSAIVGPFCAFFQFLVAAKPSNSTSDELSFFLFLPFVPKWAKTVKKHGRICNFDHKFQI